MSDIEKTLGRDFDEWDEIQHVLPVSEGDMERDLDWIRRKYRLTNVILIWHGVDTDGHIIDCHAGGLDAAYGMLSRVRNSLRGEDDNASLG